MRRSNADARALTRKFRLTDAIGITIIIFGLLITALNLFAVRQKQSVDVESATVRERPPVIPFF